MGPCFPLSSKKVARAINAASANRPMVVLANLSGFDGAPVAAVVFARHVERRARHDPACLAALRHALGSIDAIIAARDLRRRLIEAVRSPVPARRLFG